MTDKKENQDEAALNTAEAPKDDSVSEPALVNEPAPDLSETSTPAANLADTGANNSADKPDLKSTDSTPSADSDAANNDLGSGDTGTKIADDEGTDDSLSVDAGFGMDSVIDDVLSPPIAVKITGGTPNVPKTDDNGNNNPTIEENLGFDNAVDFYEAAAAQGISVAHHTQESIYPNHLLRITLKDDLDEDGIKDLLNKAGLKGIKFSTHNGPKDILLSHAGQDRIQVLKSLSGIDPNLIENPDLIESQKALKRAYFTPFFPNLDPSDDAVLAGPAECLKSFELQQDGTVKFSLESASGVSSQFTYKTNALELSLVTDETTSLAVAAAKNEKWNDVHIEPLGSDGAQNRKDLVNTCNRFLAENIALDEDTRKRYEAALLADPTLTASTAPAAASPVVPVVASTPSVPAVPSAQPSPSAHSSLFPSRRKGGISSANSKAHSFTGAMGGKFGKKPASVALPPAPVQ